MTSVIRDSASMSITNNIQVEITPDNIRTRFDSYTK